MTALDRLGWCSFFHDQLAGSDPSLVPARVLEDMGRVCRIHTGHAEHRARVPQRLFHEAGAGGILPTTGDFVLIRLPAASQDALVVRVLRRRTRLARKAAGRGSAEQLLAANVDRVLIVQALDGDFNPRRLERYLVAVREGGACPVVVLNKVDLHPDPAPCVLLARSVAAGAPVHAIGALLGQGLDSLAAYFTDGATLALAGSSGVGKSTLLNRLAGRELQRVAAVREADARGRHTTSARRLVLLDGGGMLLDMPGMRELALLDAGEGLDATFADLAEISGHCRFRDCAHGTEPGCAVRAAIEDGSLDPERLESSRKLEREARHAALKHDTRLKREQTAEWKRIHRDMRKLYRERRKG